MFCPLRQRNNALIEWEWVKFEKYFPLWTGDVFWCRFEGFLILMRKPPGQLYFSKFYKILDRGLRGVFFLMQSSGSILTILAPQIFVVSFIEAIFHLVTIIITPSHFVKMFIFSPTRKFLVLIWSELNH